MVDYQLKLKLSLATINRVRACQAKSVFLKKVEKLPAKSVFLFKNLRMLVFVSSIAWKNFWYEKFEIFFKKKFKCKFIISIYKFSC